MFLFFFTWIQRYFALDSYIFNVTSEVFFYAIYKLQTIINYHYFYHYHYYHTQPKLLIAYYGLHEKTLSLRKT